MYIDFVKNKKSFHFIQKRKYDDTVLNDEQFIYI